MRKNILHTIMMKITTTIKNILSFYIEGFKNMGLGKSLWQIIAIKLFIMFAVLKIFFFPNILEENFSNDQQRGDYILQQLTKKDN